MGAGARCDRPLPLLPPAGGGRSGLGREELLALVEQVAALLPSLPRLQLLDVVDAEWVRLRAAAEPLVAAFWCRRRCCGCARGWIRWRGAARC